ncbi:unnamed protein product, partial [Vitis vinifera]|uniref:Uncharacterized protein n=1 Tax=Vitis vinifera TaxID=29760 RepID=D7U6E0_VITVI
MICSFPALTVTLIWHERLLSPQSPESSYIDGRKSQAFLMIELFS